MSSLFPGAGTARAKSTPRATAKTPGALDVSPRMIRLVRLAGGLACRGVSVTYIQRKGDLMSRSVSNPTSYTVTVWAGPDMYTQIRLPAVPFRADPETEYQEVSNRIQGRMEDDFGKGAELKRREPQVYDISVDKVAIEP